MAQMLHIPIGFERDEEEERMRKEEREDLPEGMEWMMLMGFCPFLRLRSVLLALTTATGELRKIVFFNIFFSKNITCTCFLNTASLTGYRRTLMVHAKIPHQTRIVSCLCYHVYVYSEARSISTGRISVF